MQGIFFEKKRMSMASISKLLPSICLSYGVSRRTNHCLRATMCTALYQNGIDEKEIMRISGHNTEKGVRKYMKPDAKMEFVSSEACLNLFSKDRGLNSKPTSSNRSLAVDSKSILPATTLVSTHIYYNCTLNNCTFDKKWVSGT